MKFVIIHHTAVSYKKNADQFKATDRYHKSKWPWFRSKLGYWVGYNYEIAKNGRIHQARQIGERTAGAYQLGLNNGTAIHIALDGNFDIEKPFPNQIYALRDLLRDLVAKGYTKKDLIYFHRTFAHYKSCPGKKMNLCFIRSLVNK